MNPLKKLVLKLETTDQKGNVVSVERRLTARWKEVDGTLEEFATVENPEEALKDLIVLAMTDFVKDEGNTMITELVRKASV